MKMGLIKKTLVCVLSLSFITLLAACDNKSEVVSKTNVFAKKDILAYAKKYKEEKKSGKVDLVEFDLADYASYKETEYYAVVRNKNTSTYYLYIKKTNKLIDLKTDDTETIYDVTRELVVDEYGYYIIEYSTDNVMIVDFDGEEILAKKNVSNVEVDALSNLNLNTNGEGFFYNSIKYYDIALDKEEELVFKVDVKEENEKTSYTRSQISSRDEIDYSVFDSETSYIPVKKYNIYFDFNNTNEQSFIVKDLKGNITSTFQFDIKNKFYVLDDKLFYQTKEAVSFYDDYTYANGTNYYILKTYSIDLSTGKTKDIKDYGYVLSGLDTIPGYNEKKNRTYVAGIYGILTKIVDKRLSSDSITAMLDKNGKILSNKVGEKGYELECLNDNTYILYDHNTTTIMDKKGNTKANYINSSNSFRKIYADYQNELFFAATAGSENYGYVLDSNLKKIDYYGIKELNWYTRFNNGNAICSVIDGIALINFSNKKVNEVERYDFDNFGTTFDTYKIEVVGCKYVMTNDYLTENNLYVVQIKKDTGWDIEIKNADGETLKQIENVTDIEFNDTVFFMKVITTETEIVFGATISSNLN